MALQDYYNTGDDSNVSIDTTHWEAQTFQASSNYNLTSVKLLLYRHADHSPGTITVSIRAVSGVPQTSVPTDGDLESGTTVGSSLTTNSVGEWREITMDSPLSLTSGTYYAVVVICEDVGHFALKWRGKSAGNYATGNRASSTDGSSWSGSARDNMFEIHGESVSYSELSGTIAGVGAMSGNLSTTAISLLSGTIIGTSAMSGNLGSVNVGVTESAFYKRLVAVGNDQFWFEAI